MSETVLVSLITFASGFLGVLVGAIANYKISKLGVQADKGKLLHDEKRTVYGEVVGAYLALVDYIASHDELNQGTGDELIEIARRFFQAQSAAVLVAPEPVQLALFQAAKAIQEMVNTGLTPGNSEVFALLTGAMREDLLSFSDGAEKG